MSEMAGSPVPGLRRNSLCGARVLPLAVMKQEYFLVTYQAQVLYVYRRCGSALYKTKRITHSCSQICKQASRALSSKTKTAMCDLLLAGMRLVIVKGFAAFTLVGTILIGDKEHKAWQGRYCSDQTV